jgi:hypothetical protein
MENTWDLDEDISSDENLPVSSTDELTTDGGSIADRIRRLCEFSRVNSPLSRVDIQKRKTRGWIGRHPENIQDLIPLGEKPEAKPK